MEGEETTVLYAENNMFYSREKIYNNGIKPSFINIRYTVIIISDQEANFTPAVSSNKAFQDFFLLKTIMQESFLSLRVNMNFHVHSVCFCFSSSSHVTIYFYFLHVMQKKI